MPLAFALPAGYQDRIDPSYYDDEASSDVVWQPDVYEFARSLASRADRRVIIDLGCGSGLKLAKLEGFDVIAVDIEGPNLEAAKRNLPDAQVIAFDLSIAEDLPISDETLGAALIVCSDVIEHLPDPSPLLRFTRRAADAGAIALFSTPERHATWGTQHMGPPPNPAHCREWTLVEFVALLREAGLAYLAAGLTRTNDAGPVLATSLVAIFPCAELVDRHRAELENVTVEMLLPALVAVRDRAAAAESALEEIRAQHDESEGWHDRHFHEAEEWWRARVDSLEAQLDELQTRLVAEIDHRDRVIGELKAMNADLQRSAD